MICSKCQIDKPLSEYYLKSEKKRTHRECKVCFRKRMSHRHQENKITLVNEHGGRCRRCGYDKCLRILTFHHVNPATKSFGISKRLSANLDVLRKEAAKCILLCPNCHGEHHNGFPIQV